ncbi:sigma-70 family RNA polymerase sigma factor [Rheinheimera salexigens]|uniref:sigma-70 family RNA polymerase sigma factor n=1 Tax=Rheinheimera salexigens TaxID=1628148 RepID=UPI000AAD5CC0|nr:sigma-70 family RNA polymerase sigma factor [Rheinheimera salexigens]
MTNDSKTCSLYLNTVTLGTINNPAQKISMSASDYVAAKKAKLAAVLGIKSTSRQRYELLVKQYHTDLYRYAYWLCKDPDITKDIVQETYLRAWKSLDSLLDPKAAKAWLFTILRRENARRFERKQFDYDYDAEQDNLIDTTQVSAAQTYDNEKLRAQIALLPLDYREPLILQVLAGFSSDEIAELLNLNVNTVNTRLFRARNKLRSLLSNAYSGENGHE